jgi:hypothetical protein
MTGLSVLDAAGAAPIAGDAAGLSRWPAAPQQGTALSRRSADRGGDRRRDAPCQRRPTWLAVAGAHRGALAWRPAHPGGARARRTRPGRRARVAAGARRQGWPTPRDRYGRLGLGTAAAVARCAHRATRGAAVLHHRWPDARGALGRTRGSASSSGRLAVQAGVRRRFAPHQLRHAHAVELAREGVPLNIIQRQLGHANLGTTSTTCRASTPGRSSPPSTADARP